MSTDTKPTNPKDIIGSKKLPLELIPEIPGEALPFLEGALKYGRFNWRIAGVRASIYYAAMRRHQKKWWNGQNADAATRIHHLLSVMACCRIVLDAELAGKLTDDRPPRQDIDKAIQEAEEIAAHLRELFKDHNPKQYTIADSQPAVKRGVRHCPDCGVIEAALHREGCPFPEREILRRAPRGLDGHG